DSIKRVEILSGVQERAPDAPAVDPEHLGRLRTLKQIVDFIASRASATPESPTAQPSPTRGEGVSAARVSRHLNGDLERVLLDVVAEKTGYPRETLALDMDLESDLGIDSIKRVEILSGVQERAPDAPAVDPEHLGRLRTLRQIVDFIEKRAATGTGTGPGSGTGPGNGTGSGTGPRCAIERRLLVTVDLPNASPEAIRIAPGHEAWITDDGSPLAPAIAERLAALGIAARVLRAGERPGGFVGALVLLAPDARFEGASWPASSEAFMKDAFLLAKEAGPSLRAAGKKGGALLATVSRQGGAFGLSSARDHEPDPTQGGLAGLAKTVAQEWPEVSARALDLGRGFASAEAAARAVVRELGQAGPIEVGLEGDRRTGLELVARPLGGSREHLLSRGDTVVVTGGARGVTAEVALALAKACAPLLLLLGRTGEPAPEPAWLAGLEDEGAIKRAIAQELSRSGERPGPRAIGEAHRKIVTNREVLRNLERISKHARVVYRSVDARDAASLGRVLDEARSSLGPIKGLIHGAGVIEDRRIEEKTPDQFAAVLDTKVASLRALLEATERDDLVLLALFSSASGRYGRRGQVDYAVANEVLNKVAQREARRRPRARVVALGFGPWEGGMVSPSLAREFAKEGVAMIPLLEGGEATAADLLAPASEGVELLLGAGLEPRRPLEPARARLAAAPRLETAFERTLDLERHPFLRSHVLGGRPVLPLAVTMEWLAHGALHGNPGLLFHGFDDLRVLRAVALDAGPRPIRVVAGPALARDGVFEVPVELRTGENVHARATAVLAAALPEASGFEPPADLVAHPYPRAIESAYDELLFHGPLLRGIEAIEGLGSRGIVARARSAPPPSAWIAEPLRTAWIADPLALDASFQLAILWCHEELGAASLPARIERYRQFRAFPRDGVTVSLIVEKAGPHGVSGEIVFSDSRGSVVARISGYECTVDAALAAAFRKNASPDEE
ncbi:SDR family NAD(P)-dependent oxidoreductase, partial [bacterium]|nr:SDR family NAD(P)-dependent oxidoreductase [bacterium]